MGLVTGDGRIEIRQVRRRSAKLTHLCSREVAHWAEEWRDFLSKEARLGSEEEGSESASWNGEGWKDQRLS